MLFKQQHILTIKDQLYLKNCKFVQRILTKQCLPPLQNLYEKRPTGHDTRGPGILPKKHMLSVVNKSFLCKPIADWQQLCADIKVVENLKLFAQKIKKSHIEKY